MSERIDALIERFHSLYGEDEPGVWSAPGRTEISGNHTDHQHGKVLAASVNVDMLAAAAPNGSSESAITRTRSREKRRFFMVWSSLYTVLVL